MSKLNFTAEQKVEIAKEYLGGVASSLNLEKNMVLIIILFVDGQNIMKNEEY